MTITTAVGGCKAWEPILRAAVVVFLPIGAGGHAGLVTPYLAGSPATDGFYFEQNPRRRGWWYGDEA